jgi:hypothetical protein
VAAVFLFVAVFYLKDLEENDKKNDKIEFKFLNN